MSHIAAWTDTHAQTPGFLPPYINVTRNGGGGVLVMTRDKTGKSIIFEMPKEAWEAFLRDSLKEFMVNG